MPKVGKKTFPYTEAGQQDAAGYASRSGKKMTPKKAMPKKAKAKSKGMYK